MGQPIGMRLLRHLILAAVVIAYVVIFALWLRKVWVAPDDTPPTLDGNLVAAGTALAGALGAGFALAMGIEKHKPDDRSLTLGFSALPRIDGEALVLTLGVWLYAIVSGACVVTLAAHSGEMPADLEALTVAFTAYVITLATSAFGAIRSS